MSTCLHPIIVKDKIFPCGKCPICRQNYRQSLSNRFLLESAFSPGPSYFFTLTYDDIHIPFSNGKMCFCKKHVQNFIRYLRKDAKLIFKYFITCEYGENTQRPHYHGILFFQSEKSNSPQLFELQTILEKYWKHGFIQLSSLNDSRIAYAVKYCLKDEYQFFHKYQKDDPCKPFRLFSLKPGIGSSAIPFINDYIYNSGEIRNFFTFNGKNFTFDQFIKRHIDPSLKSLLDDSFNSRKSEYTQRLLSSRLSHQKEEFDILRNSSIFVSDFSYDTDILVRRKRLKSLKNNKL